MALNLMSDLAMKMNESKRRKDLGMNNFPIEEVVLFSA
jgi:hypothetical protein